VQHAYALPGDYAAVVTASNSTSSVQAESPVHISDRIGVRAGADRSIGEDSALALVATFVDLDGSTGHTASIAWGDGVVDDGAVNEAAGLITGSHRYADQGAYSATVTLYAQDGREADDALLVSVANVAPAVDASPVNQVVLSGGAIATIVFTATDVEADDLAGALSWAPDPGTRTPGAPDGLVLVVDPCVVDAGGRLCTWHVMGDADLPEGTYVLRLGVTDGDGGATDRNVTLIVRPLTSMLVFDADNPTQVPATTPGGTSGPFTLGVCLWATNTSPPGGVDLEQLSMELVPAGSGEAIPGTANLPGDGRCLQFSFDQVPVGVYTVRVTLAGGPSSQILEGVLIVIDP
jgi:hypothetical protein